MIFRPQKRIVYFSLFISSGCVSKTSGFSLSFVFYFYFCFVVLCAEKGVKSARGTFNPGRGKEGLNVSVQEEGVKVGALSTLFLLI